jgi:hypothetical protein
MSRRFCETWETCDCPASETGGEFPRFRNLSETCGTRMSLLQFRQLSFRFLRRNEVSIRILPDIEQLLIAAD